MDNGGTPSDIDWAVDYGGELIIYGELKSSWICRYGALARGQALLIAHMLKNQAESAVFILQSMAPVPLHKQIDSICDTEVFRALCCMAGRVCQSKEMPGAELPSFLRQLQTAKVEGLKRMPLDWEIVE